MSTLLFKRITAGVVAVAMTAGLLTVGAVPAAAGTVVANYICVGMGQAAVRTFDITITVPATATLGTPVTVTATVASRHPVSSPQPAGAYRGRLTITLGGAGTGSLIVDPMANPPLRPGEPSQITGSTLITFNTAGTVTFRASDNSWFGVVDQLCRPMHPESMPVAATTRVS